MADPVMLQTMHACLQQTLSADKDQRHQAEAYLKQHELTPQFLVALFQVVADTSLNVDISLRQAGVVCMKNLIIHHWEHKKDDDDAQQMRLHEQDKVVVRDNILEALVFAAPPIRVQLAVCIKHIAYSDFPVHWSSLLDKVWANLTSQDEQRMHGALTALRMLVKKYEFKQGEARQPLYIMVGKLFPLLQQLLQHLVGLEKVNEQHAEMQKLLCKIFYSCTKTSIPPYLHNPQNITAWMESLIKLMQTPLLEQDMPEDLDARPNWPAWKAKKWVAHIFHRLFQRYGNNKSSLSAEEKQFQEFWMSQYSGRCLSACFGLLALRSQGHYSPDRVVTLSLNFVDEGIKHPPTWKAMRQQLSFLMLQIVFPLLCFNDADKELWEEDPNEFVRKEFDVIEDFYNPRSAATNVLCNMCKGKKRQQDTLVPFLAHCSQQLQQYKLSPQTEQSCRVKDGCLLGIGSLAAKLCAVPEYRATLEPMLVTHVLEEFESKCGFLRARACWVYGQFMAEMRSDSSSIFTDTPSLHIALSMVLRCLQDPELPVRIQAAMSLQSCLETGIAIEQIRTVLPQLLEVLFNLMNEIGHEEVVSTLDSLIERFGEEMAPYAVTIVTTLTTTFGRLFANEEDEESALAAMGVIRAITTMMESVHKMPHLYPQLEAAVSPLLDLMISPDGIEYFEDVIEICSYITYYSPQISPRMWSLLPRLCQAFDEWAFDYVNNLLVPLDNYISRDPEVFMTIENGAYVQLMFGIATKTMQSMTDEGEVHAGPKLLEALLHNCRGRIDNYMPHVMSLVERRLLGKTSAGAASGYSFNGEQLVVNTTTAGESMCKSSSLRTLVMDVVASAFHYNAALAWSCLQQTGQLAAILKQWMEHLQHLPRVHDLKMSILGMTAILQIPSMQIPQETQGVYSQLMPTLLTAIPGLLMKCDQLRKRNEQEEGQRRGSDDDGLGFDRFGGFGGDDDDDGDDEDGLDDEAGDKLLAQLQKDAADFYDELGDDLEEEEMYSSPVDDINELVFFAEVLATKLQQEEGLQQQLPSLLQPQQMAAMQAAVTQGLAMKEQAATVNATPSA